MTTDISIMDLGLNEFRLDLLDYIKHRPNIDKTPFGLHLVVTASEDTPAGAIYVLKNRSNSVNIRDCIPLNTCDFLHTAVPKLKTRSLPPVQR